MGLIGVPLGSSQLYGRMRSGRDGNAQAFTAGAPIPEPRRGAHAAGGVRLDRDQQLAAAASC